jgi:hypothetical protein
MPPAYSAVMRRDVDISLVEGSRRKVSDGAGLAACIGLGITTR